MPSIPDHLKPNEDAYGVAASCGQEVPMHLRWLSQAFDTTKEMGQHKVVDPNHDYCKKCDMDCDSWDQFTQHKVGLMSPFLEGNFEESSRTDKPVHIVCEFCGEDFKTFGGRKLHRTKTHPAEQRITCKGCNHLFTCASHLLAHYGSGECTAISQREFKGAKQKKHVHKQMMSAPDRFVANIESNMQSQLQIGNEGYSVESSLSGQESTTDQDSDSSATGGVLLDSVDLFQYGCQDPMAAEIDLVSFKEQYYKEHPEQAPPTRHNLERSDERPGKLWEPTLAEAMARLTLGSTKAPSVAPSDYSNITSRLGGLKVVTTSDLSAKASAHKFSTKSQGRSEAHHSLTSPAPGESALSALDKTSDTASQSTTTINDNDPWATKNTTKTLSQSISNPNSRLTTLAPSDPDPRANLFRVCFWDPSSTDYDPTRFYHAAIRRYCCPFPDCNSIAQYTSVAEIELHLTIRHTTQQYRCPACLKVFKSSVALVSHCESAAANCRIQETGSYEGLVDEVSGGYLQAKRVKEVAIRREEDEEKGAVRAGEPTGGVARTFYEGVLPRH